VVIAPNGVPGPEQPSGRPKRTQAGTEPPEPHQAADEPGDPPAPASAARPAADARLPRWWVELLFVAVLYGVYTGIRGVKSDNLSSADRVARRLLHLEQVWHLNPEHPLNNLLLHATALAVPACYFYATLHYIVTPVVLVWMYRRHPAQYRRARSTILLATILGLVGFWTLPTTPPRLLPGAGFHDTMAQVSGWGWWGQDASAPRGLGGLTNQYAAMPSLHCGWALWCGFLVARYARRPAVRVIGACYPLLTTLVVMSTGNHYFLDAVGGIVDVTVAAAIVLLVGSTGSRRRRPAGGSASASPLRPLLSQAGTAGAERAAIRLPIVTSRNGPEPTAEPTPG